jgi:hypothetical protein
MSRILPHFLFFFLFFLLSATGSAQTVLYPGDIAILGVATDMGGCGFSAESDEFSFVCFRDITTGTSIDITDNGWETGSAGFWGDGEGTLNLTRTGATVAAGTVITIHAVNNAGNWAYSVAGFSPGWTITQINTPGGPFNLEPGGDQIYIMQGGTWDNQKSSLVSIQCLPGMQMEVTINPTFIQMWFLAFIWRVLHPNIINIPAPSPVPINWTG